MAMQPHIALHDERLRAAVGTPSLSVQCAASGLPSVQMVLEALAAGPAELHVTVLTGAASSPAGLRLASSAAHVTIFKPLVLVPSRLVLHPGQDYYVDWAGGPGGESVEVRFSTDDAAVAALSGATVRAGLPGSTRVRAQVRSTPL
jgi:hypothetical protein